MGNCSASAARSNPQQQNGTAMVVSFPLELARKELSYRKYRRGSKQSWRIRSASAAVSAGDRAAAKLRARKMIRRSFCKAESSRQSTGLSFYESSRVKTVASKWLQRAKGSLESRKQQSRPQTPDTPGSKESAERSRTQFQAANRIFLRAKSRSVPLS